MITKATYIERRGAALRALGQEIVRLTDYADKVTADVAVGYYGAIHELQATHDIAARKLRELRAVSDKTWAREDATADVEQAWKELRNAVLNAISTTYGETSQRPSERHSNYTPCQSNRARRISPRGSCY